MRALIRFFLQKKTISFNSRIKNNDGLLANHIAQAEKTSYGFAVSAIAFEVLNWKKTLDENGVILLKNIGELRLNSEGNIVFRPNDQTNYLATSFGLSPFVSPVVKKEIFEKKIEKIAAKEKDAVLLYENEEQTKSSNSFLRYAAILVLGLGITGSIGYPLYQNQIDNQTLLVEKSVQKKVQDKIQEATFFIKSPLPAVTLSVDSAKVETVEPTMPYHIMAGAFRSEQNARKAYNQLIKDGFKARMLKENKHGLFPVLYGSYATMKEAEVAQKEIQKGENPQAWILVENL
ncbi:SPOR domain-containing protein [Flavobacterium sp. CGRL2]